MVRVLRPRLRNAKKRLVKSPKVSVRDTGILRTLLGITTMNDLLGNINVGASWEPYVVEQLCGSLPDRDASFYRTAAGAEIDLVPERGDRRIAIDAKSASSPRIGRGFHEATKDIEATDRYVVAPLSRSEPLRWSTKQSWVHRMSCYR